MMLPFVMIAYLNFGIGNEAVQRLEQEFQTMEACINASHAISQQVTAVGFCIDRYTGQVGVWSSGGLLNAPPPKHTPDDDQSIPQ